MESTETTTQERLAMNLKANPLPPPPISALKEILNLENLEIEWLAGDGSDRCYYRIRSQALAKPLVLMQLSDSDAKLLAEDRYPWILMQRELAKTAIKVPKLVATLKDYAALVIEDYGDVMLESRVFSLKSRRDWEGIVDAYRNCFEICLTMLNMPKSEVWTYRSFDESQLGWELRFFAEHYLEPNYGSALSAEDRDQFQTDVEALCTFLTPYSKYFVHRDFHSRNLMVQGDGLAVIDFQDARLGQASYDLVSLIFDSYVPFSQKQRLELLDLAKEVLGPTGHWNEVEETWRPMLLQRQLKAIGTFGFLTNVKKRGNYLKYVPAAVGTLVESGLSDQRWPWISGKLLTLLGSEIRDS